MSQRSTVGRGVRQEKEGREDVVLGPEPGGQNHAKVADTVCVAAPDQVGNDILVKTVEMVEKLKTEKLSLHGDLVTEKAAHARALTDSICL